MKYDQMPTGMPNEYSEEMIEQNIALADYLGLQGTPAIFLSDGRGPFGAMSAKALAHKIISAEHYLTILFSFKEPAYCRLFVCALLHSL